MDTKVCRKCGGEKDVSEYYPEPCTPDGLHRWCKDCTKAHAKAWAKAHPGRDKGKSKRWTPAQREQNRLKCLDWWHDNTEKQLAASRKWNSDHPEQLRARVKQWAKDNPENHKVYTENRRARKNAEGGIVTPEEWKWLFGLLGHTCLACGATSDLTQDHVVPLKKGGLHFIENIQPLCRRCNSKKHDKTIDYRPQWLIENFAQLKAQAGLNERTNNCRNRPSNPSQGSDWGYRRDGL